jgi:hypothetical protein
MKMGTTTRLPLTAADATGLREDVVSDITPEMQVGEMLQRMIARLDLPPNDSSGQPVTYQARRERGARALNAAEFVGDVLEEGDRVFLEPDINAG